MTGKWERVRLGEYILQVRGVSYSPDDVSDTPNGDYIPILRANNIQNEGLNFDDLIYIHNSKISQEQLIREGDIVVCTSSGSKNLVGKSARAQKGLNVSFGAFCKVVRVNKTINSQYIGHYFNSPQYRQIISNLSGGANINNIRNEHIANLTIPLPPLDEQKRIAEVLDKASELIKKRKEQIRLMDQLAKSLFIEMFGDPVENPMGWDVKKLGTITHKITDGVHAKPNYTESGMPFISVQNISSGYLNFKKCKYVSLEDYNQMIKSTFPEYGDILYTKVGTYGIPAYVNTSEKFCLYVSVCLIKPIHKLINAKFLSFSLGMPYLKRQADKRIKGIGVPDLHLNQIREFDICYPPISLQNEFADRITVIEEQKALLQNGLAKMETAYKALMQKYFG